MVCLRIKHLIMNIIPTHSLCLITLSFIFEGFSRKWIFSFILKALAGSCVCVFNNGPRCEAAELSVQQQQQQGGDGGGPDRLRAPINRTEETQMSPRGEAEPGPVLETEHPHWRSGGGWERETKNRDRLNETNPVLLRWVLPVAACFYFCVFIFISDHLDF